MNKEKILETKKAYEDKIQSAIAQALSFYEKDVVVNWSLDGTIIYLTKTSDQVINKYTLNVSDTDISITMLGYRIHKDANDSILAYENIPMSINAQTLNTLHQIITSIINSDPLEVTDATEAQTEAMEAHQ